MLRGEEGRKTIRESERQKSKYVISGIPFPTLGTAWGYAKTVVQTECSFETFCKRFKSKSHEKTFDNLCKAPHKRRSAAARSRKSNSKKEVADAIAALDARKREMGL